MSQQHIDFHYDPVSGPISGPSFVTQTEKAINELGEIAITGSNEAKLIAREALTNSKDAQAIANSALETAQDANTASQNAVQTANNANSTAQEGKSTALAAEARANEAYDIAVTTDSKAGTATSTANSADNKANMAISTANSANSTAQSANTTAQAALDAANNANGYYIVVDEAVDADVRIESTEKSLITNTASTGFPAGLPFPLYFNVALEDSGRYSTQFCWSQDSGSIYKRTGSLTKDEKGNAIAAWGAWESIASIAPSTNTTLGGGFVATREELNSGVKNSSRGSSPAFVSVEQVSFAAFCLCEFYYFRHPILKPGFQPAQGGLLQNAATLYPEAWAYLQTAEGQVLCRTEAEWQAMTTDTWATLADGTKIGWNGIGGAPFYVPDFATGTLRLPDLRGMYMEAAGFDGLGVAGAHGDAIRPLYGSIAIVAHTDRGESFGVFSFDRILQKYATLDGFPWWEGTLNITASRQVPVANKNQPRAWGALACCYLGMPK